MYFNTRFIHFANRLYFFSVSKTQILSINVAINRFLSSRGLSELFNAFISGPVLHKFDILGWSILPYYVNKFNLQVSTDNITDYKRKLKLVVKNSFSENFLFTLEKLNSLISDWSNKYCSIQYNWDIWGGLDVYLNKLLWNWAKKRHPRRPRTWIYSRYWKFFPTENIWKFFFIDFSVGKCLFLNSHKKYSLNLYCLPYSINIFNSKNYNKLGLLWLRKSSQVLSDLFLILYKKQSGKCFCCKQFFFRFTFKGIKLVKIKPYTNILYKYVLIHTNCLISCSLFKNLLF